MDENVAALMGLLYYVTTPKSIFIPSIPIFITGSFALMVLCLLEILLERRTPRADRQQESCGGWCWQVYS